MVQAEAEALLERPGGGRQPDHRRRPRGRHRGLGPDAAARRSSAGSDLSVALERQAELLGWHATTVIHADAATARIEQLDHGDAVLVIDHDPRRHPGARRCAAARCRLRRRAGLASNPGAPPPAPRATSAYRQSEIDRLHGPAGLDIGGRNPAETAVSIVAEIIAPAVRPHRRTAHHDVRSDQRMT